MHRSSRVLSLIFVCVLLGLAGVPSAPAAAEDRHIVERWRGTIRISKTFNTEGTVFALLFTGKVFEQYDMTYDIAVDEDGFANGDVAVNLRAATVQMLEPRVCAVGVSECVVTHQIVKSSGSTFWEGKRFTDSQSRPRLSLERTVGDGTTPQVITKMCGKAAPLYQTYQCFDDGAKDWGFETPTEFVIVPEREGRAPLALPLDAHFQNENMSFHATGQLIGTGEEPMVDLDVELLERSRFFSQVSVDDQLDANLNWNSPDGGHLTWQVEQEVDRIGPTKATKVTKQKNVGFPSPGQQTVQVQATNSIGKTSAPDNTQITAIRWPVAAGAPGNVEAQKTGPVVAYRFRYVFPLEPFTAEIDHVPEAVPFFGGGPLGIEEAQSGGEVEVLSTGEGSAKLDGGGMFHGMKGSLGAKMTVSAQAVLDNQYGVEFPAGEFSLKVSGVLKNQEPVLELIPAFRGPVLTLQKFSPAAYYAINKLSIAAEMEPNIDLKFQVKDNQGNIEFVSGQARPGMGIKVNLVIDLVDGVAQGNFGVGAEIGQTFQVPAPYMGDLELKLTATGKIVMGAYSFEAEGAVLCKYIGNTLACDFGKMFASRAEGGPVWHLVDRSYVNDPNYAKWTGSSTPVTNGSVSDQQLVAVVNPQAMPSLAVVPGQGGGARWTYVVWGHDRAGAATMSRDIMLASRESTNTWQGSYALTNDNNDDWNPQVVGTPSGYPLVLWQRMDTATPPDINTDAGAYFSHMQIAAGRAGVSNQQPLTPIMLSNSSLNYRPQLGASSTGGIAAWISNAGNQIGGDAAHPDAIMVSRYTESTNSWSAAVPAVSNLDGLVDFKLASAGTNAAIVYSRDTDGDRATDQDRELFVIRWQNNAWSAPQQLTTNSLADDAPQLALSATGEPLFVWKQNNALVSLTSWSGTPAAMNAPEAAYRNDYALVRSSDGAAALVWQELQPNDTRVGYMIYDRANGAWSDQHSVSPPLSATSAKTTLAASLSPVLISGSSWEKPKLAVAYLLGEVNSVTRTVDGKTMPNVQEIGAHSLRVLEETIGANLSISSADITTTPANATPGQMVQVQAVVRSTGELVAGNVPVNLLSAPTDDPFAQPNVVATKRLALLKAGETSTITFDVARPTEALRWSVQIEQPDRFCEDGCIPGVVEDNYSDNQARVPAEYAITPLPTEYTPQGAVAMARVTQSGALYTSQPTVATVRLDAPDGPIVAEAGVDFPIVPSESVELSAWLPPELVGTGRHTLYWELDPGATLGEHERGDNTTIATVDILPDLTSSALVLGWKRTAGAPAPVWLRVENTGSASSAAAKASIWSGDQQLGQIDIPAIEPGGSAEVTGTLPGSATGYERLVVRLDSDNTVAEVNENNNLVIGGGLGAVLPPPNGSNHHVFVPLIVR